MAIPEAKADELRFEESLARLEATVKRLESENLGLDEALKLYELGVSLAMVCRRRLDEAEKRIQRLSLTEGGPCCVDAPELEELSRGREGGCQEGE